MKIEEDNQPASVSSPLTRIDQISVGSTATGNSRTAAIAGDDQVDVSVLGGKISTELSSQSAVRADRVSQLQALFVNGGLLTNSAQTGSAIVDDALSRSAL